MGTVCRKTYPAPVRVSSIVCSRSWIVRDRSTRVSAVSRAVSVERCMFDNGRRCFGCCSSYDTTSCSLGLKSGLIGSDISGLISAIVCAFMYALVDRINERINGCTNECSQEHLERIPVGGVEPARHRAVAWLHRASFGERFQR